MQTTTIGGEDRTIGEFSAFKALKAMEIVGAIEEDIRELMNEAADFRREFGERNYMELSRAEARRQFRAQPLYQHHENDDGGIVAEPVLRDGVPVLGPDPLGHLTDADWEASGNLLRLPEQPGQDALMMALAPKAFAKARVSVLRLIALALVGNADLERWDGDTDIDAELDDEAQRIVHRAMADELLGVAIAVMHACRDQLAGPFQEAVEAGREMFGRSETPESDEEAKQGPMMVVSEEEASSTDGSPTSSTDSPGDTGGTPTRSSTEPASGSSSL